MNICYNHKTGKWEKSKTDSVSEAVFAEKNYSKSAVALFRAMVKGETP